MLKYWPWNLSSLYYLRLWVLAQSKEDMMSSLLCGISDLCSTRAVIVYYGSSFLLLKNIYFIFETDQLLLFIKHHTLSPSYINWHTLYRSSASKTILKHSNGSVNIIWKLTLRLREYIVVVRGDCWRWGMLTALLSSLNKGQRQ